MAHMLIVMMTWQCVDSNDYMARVDSNDNMAHVLIVMITWQLIERL
jgi:hypothetical protein